MSRDTNYQITVIEYLRKLSSAVSSSASTGATEQTALDILAALTQINTNLTDNTNALLAEIRDSNVAQEALITATNNLLTQINADIVTLHNDNVITNQELADVNIELDNILAALNAISAQDSTFHADLLACLDLIKASLTNIDANTANLETQLQTLIGQTDQVETLLSTINTTLNTNSSLNVAKLEEIRVLLEAIDKNTDEVEDLLKEIDVSIDAVIPYIDDVEKLLEELNNTNAKILDQVTPKGSTQYIVKLDTNGATTSFGAGKVNYVDVIIIGSLQTGTIEIDNAGNDIIDMSTEALRKYERNYETYSNKVNPHDITVTYTGSVKGYMLVEFGLV